MYPLKDDLTRVCSCSGHVLYGHLRIEGRDVEDVTFVRTLQEAKLFLFGYKSPSKTWSCCWANEERC